MRILVVGSSGKISREFIERSLYKKKFWITTSKKKLSKKKVIFFDITKSDIITIIKKKNINKVVIFTAISNPAECEAKKKYSYNVNVKYMKKLIRKLISLKIYFIIFSSEYVFDGRKGNYTEKSKTKSNMIYGKHKIEIENYIREKNYINCLILRISKTFGSHINDGTFFTNYLKLYLKGLRYFEIARDQIFSPLYVNDLVKVIDLSLKKKLTGLYNVCGDTADRRINFIKKFFNKLKIKNVKFVGVPMKKFDSKILYPINVSMKNTKIKNKLNFKFTKTTDLKLIQKYNVFKT